MKNYKKFLELKEKLHKYAEGGKVKEDHDKKNLQALKSSFDKFIKEETIEKHADGGSILPNGGQAQETQQKQYQAKEYFGKGANGAGEGVANSMGIRMSDGGDVPQDDSYLSDFAKKLREAFKTPPPQAPKEETLEDKYKKIRQQNTERANGQRSSLDGYADGGSIPSDSANTASSLSPLLKESYADSEEKKKALKMATGGWTPEQVAKPPHIKGFPGVHAPLDTKMRLNIPRAPTIKIPKRLRSINEIRGYADGGFAANSGLTPEEYEQNNKDLSSQEQQIPPTSILESQYGPEEEDADKAAGMTSDAQIGLLDRINSALGDKSQDQRNLEGMTISKDDLGDDKNPWYANKEGVLEGMKDEGEDLAEPGKSELPASDETKRERPDSDKAIEDAFKAEQETSRQPAGEEAGPKSKDSEEPPYNPITALKDAQDRRDQSQMWNQLGAIAERGAAGYAGIKPTQQETFKENMQIAQQAVDDVKDRIKQQGDDPNSPISKSFKKYLAKFSGEPVDPSMTANAGKETLPLVFKDYEAKLMQQTRKDMLADKLEERNFESQEKRDADEKKYKFLADERKATSKEKALDRQSAAQLKTEEKQEQFDRKRLDALGKALTSETASSRSAFGRGANNIRSAEAIEALTEQYKGRFDQMDERQITELARSLDGLLSQGQSTVSGTTHLLPKTAVGNVSKIVEYLRNVPTGQQQGAFVKRMLETVGREKELAKDQIKRAQGKILGPYKETLKRRPEDAKDILGPHGLEFLIDDDGKQDASSKSDEKAPEKKIVKKGYNAKTNQTQLIYDDGSSEIKDGKI